MTTTRFTKEQLIKRLEEQESSARYALGFVQDSQILRDIEMDLRINEIALASLTAEPVAWIVHSRGGDQLTTDANYVANAEGMGGIHSTPVYAAPPAPVVHQEPIAWLNDAYLARGVVDGEAGSEDAGPGYIPVYREPLYAVQPAPVVPEELLSAMEEVLRISDRDHEAWHKARNGIVSCRAAMLQGSQPVSNRDELPATQQPQNAQQNIPNNIPSGLIEAVNDLLNNDGSRGRYSAIGCGNAREKIELWLSQRQKWESQRDKNISAGNSPVIGVDLASGPDRTVEVRYFAPPGYVMVPKRLTAENGAKCLLVGEFSEKKFINCTECFGDDECETCDGSGRIEISVPVSWTNIKAIWAKGVEHFAAAPKQETL